MKKSSPFLSPLKLKSRANYTETETTETHLCLFTLDSPFCETLDLAGHGGHDGQVASKLNSVVCILNCGRKVFVPSSSHHQTSHTHTLVYRFNLPNCKYFVRHPMHMFRLLFASPHSHSISQSVDSVIVECLTSKMGASTRDGAGGKR